MNFELRNRHIRWATSALQRLRRDTQGQDLIEYALMAGVVAIAAGAFIPPLGDGINVIFSKVVSLAARIPG